MSTTNLFTATEAVYSEFDALRTSSREFNIPESLVRALDALGPVLASTDVANRKPSQANPMVDINAAGTIHNAHQALSALALVSFTERGYVLSTDERIGLHYLFSCVSDAMQAAENQARTEQKAA